MYRLALGLIAVATWENYTDIDGVVSTEAAALASLYRDLDGYPQPMRGRLEGMLRDYTGSVIDREWPAPQEGRRDRGRRCQAGPARRRRDELEPTKEREKIVQAAVLHSLDTVQEQRQLRLQAVPTGLPTALWSVVLVGALLNIVLTYLFWTDNLAMHAVLVAMLAIFIGLLVFLTAAMDNPFGPEFSISAEAFEGLLKNVMKRGRG